VGIVVLLLLERRRLRLLNRRGILWLVGVRVREISGVIIDRAGGAQGVILQLHDGALALCLLHNSTLNRLCPSSNVPLCLTLRLPWHLTLRSILRL
jgi:hypothetical protein